MTCIGCLRAPAHRVTEDGEVLAEFCEQHWAEFGATLAEYGRQYQARVANGAHPRMAERELAVRIEK